MAPRGRQIESGPKRGLGAGLFSGGTVAMVVVCCGGHALLLGVLGGVALGSVLGIGPGVLAVVLLSVVIVAVRRRRTGAAWAVPRAAREPR